MKDRVAKRIARKLLPPDVYLTLAGWWRYFRNMGLKHRHQCPVCGNRVKAFLPFGLHPRPNAECPLCGSLERQRSMWLFLRDRTDLLSGRVSILHLAPEPCLAANLSKLPGVHYVAADLDPGRAALAMDGQSLPFADDSFDCILCSHVLEHVPDDLKAVSEIFRVLKPGRWAILQVPLDRGRDETFEDPTITLPEERERVFGQRDHVRMYGRDYEDRLAGVGFRAEFDPYMKELPSDAILKYGLSTQDIFLVTKPAG